MSRQVRAHSAGLSAVPEAHASEDSGVWQCRSPRYHPGASTTVPTSGPGRAGGTDGPGVVVKVTDTAVRVGAWNTGTSTVQVPGSIGPGRKLCDATSGATKKDERSAP